MTASFSRRSWHAPAPDLPGGVEIARPRVPDYAKTMTMIYYPLSVVVLAGIREGAPHLHPHDLPLFRSLLDDGADWGMRSEYAEQRFPNGLARAFVISERFTERDPAMLVLGDDIFFGAGLDEVVEIAKSPHAVGSIPGP
jgi:glucose-1-phosphate thymidylyltransferase